MSSGAVARSMRSLGDRTDEGARSGGRDEDQWHKDLVFLLLWHCFLQGPGLVSVRWGLGLAVWQPVAESIGFCVLYHGLPSVTQKERNFEGRSEKSVPDKGKGKVPGKGEYQIQDVISIESKDNRCKM